MRDILWHLPLPFTDKMLPIHAYGFMAMWGFVFGLLVARWRARRVDISPDVITDITIAALLGGIVGSRIFYVVQYPHARQSFWSLFKIWEGGLVFYGGLFGAAAAVILVTRLRKARLLNVLDVVTPSLCIGLAFGRIGCFMRGCCYGIALKHEHWYSVTFPDGALPYTSGHAAGTPLFPSQIVSSLGWIAIFVILSLYFRRRKREGEVVALMFILYSLHRFGVEFLRSDTHKPDEFSIAQWISFIVLFAGLALMIYLRTSPPPKPPEPPPEPVPQPRRKKKKSRKKR